LSVVLGINGVFHDTSAALVIDGDIVAAAEEERFSRRKHGKICVPFSTWELPEASAKWCLRHAGISAADVDAVAYSYDPTLSTTAPSDVLADAWEGLRTLYVERAPSFLRSALPGLDESKVRFVPHHVAHAASAHLAAPFESSAVLVLDGRGERGSMLAGHARGSRLEVLKLADLPASIGLVYEELTEHLGYRRSSDEYKVMALASYGQPRHLCQFRRLLRVDPGATLVTEPVTWDDFAPRGAGDGSLDPVHADLASSVQHRLEEIMLQLADWLHLHTHESALTMAGGVALNCVANSRVFECGPFEHVWVQPAAGDAGTALGAALRVAADLGDDVQPMTTASLGRGFSADEIRHWLTIAKVPFEEPANIADAVAAVLADDGIVAWFQGRAEFGPRALGNRSLLAHPGRAENLERLNDVKGREQFRPVAPMVLAERAEEIFSGGPFPSPFMLFTHRVRDGWAERIPAVVHVDGTARIQTVVADEHPLMHRCIKSFAARTGLPVVVNTSLNTAGRPIVDDPRDALECFGSAPIDALAIGPYLVRRGAMFS
jgi:carbamoyltransferase